MKQNIVEVIAYLLEIAASQSLEQLDYFDDQEAVMQRLEEAGFTNDVVINAFDWLRELIEQQCWYADSFAMAVNANVGTNRTVRIFSLEESTRIGLEVRNFILSLEYAAILDTKMREIVINQLMQLHQKIIELVDAKWVVLLVLMSKSNKNVQDMRNYLLTTMALEV